MPPLTRRRFAFARITLAVLVFAGVNVALDAAVTNARIDLTESGRFTLSDGTRAVIRNLKEPIRLRFFFSRKVAADYAQAREYAGRVRDLLHGYAVLGGGKIKVEEIDPEPFSPEEDEANALGLTPAPTDSGEQVYFGLAGSNSIDGHEAIAYFSPNREANLEYDLTSLIYRLSEPVKPKLAILSALPLETGTGGLQAMLQGRSHPFAIYSEIARAFDVVPLSPDFETIPPGVGVLMIVAPGPLSAAQDYAIDQFVMKGGRVALFVDPDSETLSGGSASSPPATSDLPRLLRAWGVGYEPGKEVADFRQAQKVQLSNGGIALFPIWLHVAAANNGFAADDTITAGMQTLNLASVGALTPLAHATTKFTPLVSSSDSAGTVQTAIARMGMNALVDSVEASAQPLTIAARISGPAKTAFPAGPPAGVKDKQVMSARNINIVVMADSDIFDDKFWIRAADAMGRPVATAVADNGAFVLNTVENLMGSDDLISLRTRASGERPFTVVRAMQAEAETRYRSETDALEARLNETKNRLAALQAGEGGKPGELGLTAQQQKEIARFKRELVETRASLREVKRALSKDIDNLGSLLAFLNIAAMPLMVIGLAIGAAGWRRRKAQARKAKS